MPDLIIDGGAKVDRPIPRMVAKAIEVIDALPPLAALSLRGLSDAVEHHKRTIQDNFNHPEMSRRMYRGKLNAPYFASPLTVAWFEAQGMRSATPEEWSAHVAAHSEDN